MQAKIRGPRQIFFFNKKNEWGFFVPTIFRWENDTAEEDGRFSTFRDHELKNN